MKKILAILLGLLMLLSTATIFGCNKQSNSKKLTFYVPDGAPALAVAKFIKDKENFGIDGDISYNVVSASEIGTVMIKGEGDFIVMPVNAATKLYKSKADSPYVMASVITHGNLYIMSSENVNSISDLKGKVVGVIGRGLVPDLTFKAILSDAGLINDVVDGDKAVDGKITLRYFETAGDMLPLLKKGDLSIGLLPEPAATKLTSIAPQKNWTRLDVQKLYDESTKAYPQAVLMVKKSVYEVFKSEINGMDEFFNDNVNWIKTNTLEAVNAVNSALNGATASLDASIINQTVVENCKIFWQSAKDARLDVKSYIDKIISVNPQSAKAVSDDFFAN